jgi:formyltetrahydrofolate hydrolase
LCGIVNIHHWFLPWFKSATLYKPPCERSVQLVGLDAA